jgi:hypothetical protein
LASSWRIIDGRHVLKKYIDYDQSRGYPSDCNLFYERVLCGED